MVGICLIDLFKTRARDVPATGDGVFVDITLFVSRLKPLNMVKKVSLGMRQRKYSSGWTGWMKRQGPLPFALNQLSLPGPIGTTSRIICHKRIL